MRMVQVPVYKYNELKKSVQDKVLNDYIDYLINTHDENDPIPFVEKAIKENEHSRTPWFIAQSVYKYGKMDIDKAINEPDYFENGKIYSLND